MLALTGLLFYNPIMATQTEICNLALAKLGSFTISSINESSPEARQCLRAWDNTRRMVLRDYDWNFATVEATLSQLSGQEAFGYDYAYQLPSDYLRAIKFDDTYASPGQTRWKIAAGKLYSDLSDSSEAKLEYIADITDPTEWDDIFVNAFSYYLAGNIAPSITGNPELGIQMTRAGEAFLKEAKGNDTNESGLKILRGLENSKYMAAREGRLPSSLGNFMVWDFGPPN